jgi:hypothetical protein
MVGGAEETFLKARPILESFGRRVEHLGLLGAGHAMKAVNNALLAVNVLAVGEGLVALVKSGIPARKAVEVLNASSGRSFVSEYLVPQRVLTRLWPLTFRLALLDKDARIAADLLDEAGVSGPILHLPRRKCIRPGWPWATRPTIWNRSGSSSRRRGWSCTSEDRSGGRGHLDESVGLHPAGRGGSAAGRRRGGPG